MAEMRNRIVLLAAVALAFAGTAVSETANGDTPREVELAEIRREIARLQSELETMQTREAGLEGQLRRIRVELQLQESKLAEATAALDLAAARAVAAQAKVEELEAALVHVREDLRRRLAGLYRLGRQGYLRLFLSLKPDQNLLPAIRQLRFLVRRDQIALDRYLATRDQLTAQREQLEAEHRAMEEWQRREAERRNDLVRLRRRHERLLEQVARERRALAERTEKLVDKERKLSRFINSLLGQSPTPLDGTPIQDFRGVLDWPIRGEVVGEFGPRRDPRYRTEVPHNGIDIATAARSEIRAVFPGEVLFAAEFEGYGRMVVIHHPGRVFTLYSGLRDLRVAKGDVLSLGMVIGTVADQLYFEIRSENQPENPLSWLR
ncbi:MAG: peptidoglycan DD-metalloendopeptidase family protein [bacterium]|nr:peptidoglycan DD-metalloendopeptidase family protein [bacterium]